MINLQDIQRFAKFRQDLGVPVETLCFENAEHVKLYVKYPQKYVQTVYMFVNNCLSKFLSTPEVKKII